MSTPPLQWHMSLVHMSLVHHCKKEMPSCLIKWFIINVVMKLLLKYIQCISGWLSKRGKKWELALFVQVTTAVFTSSGFHSAVVPCTNKDNSISTNLKYTVVQEA